MSTNQEYLKKTPLKMTGDFLGSLGLVVFLVLKSCVFWGDEFIGESFLGSIVA